MSVTVTADVFSGRPNPRWTLNDSQIAELAEKLRRALAAAPLARQDLPDGLGYRGLVIESDDARLPPRVRVYHNVITPDDATFYRADDVEPFLLSLLR